MTSTADPAIQRSVHPSGWEVFRRNRMSILGLWLLAIFVLIAMIGWVYTPFDPNKVAAGGRMLAPNLTHPMGTDELGRDVFSRVLEGMRTSLMVGITAAAVSTILGV